MAVGIEVLGRIDTGGEIAPADRLYRLSLDQYHRMIEAEIFGPEERVELLEGVLVAKMSKNPPHVLCTDLLSLILGRLIPGGFYLSMQNPVSLAASSSEPEPDAKIVRGHPRDYPGRNPGTGDSALVIEVSDTSLAYDRTVKKRVYAQDGVPVYWIFNLVDNQLEVFTEPEGPDYRTLRILGPDESVALMLDGQDFSRLLVRDLLP